MYFMPKIILGRTTRTSFYDRLFAYTVWQSLVEVCLLTSACEASQ